MTARTSRIVSAFFSGRSVPQLAKLEKVTPRQIYRVLATAEVREAMDVAARDAVRGANHVISAGAREAADSLVRMGAGKIPARPARVAAAAAVLKFAAAFIQAVDVDVRLAKIERALDQLEAQRAATPTRWQ